MERDIEQELDDIMEDLIVGHNFDYARGALIRWRDAAVKTGQKDLLEVLVNTPGYTHDDVYYAAVKTLTELNEDKSNES